MAVGRDHQATLGAVTNGGHQRGRKRQVLVEEQLTDGGLRM